MTRRAVLLDFNGTLSDDEPIMCAIFQELFAERGRPLARETYFAELAGHSDLEIVETWLGVEDPGLVAEKVERYRARAADGSTVRDESREAVRVAAADARVAVVTGAARAEVEAVLSAARIDRLISATVTADEVERGKPDPEGYLRALGLLGVEAPEAVAFEDSKPGIDSARAAGIRCVAVRGTLPPEQLAGADEIVESLGADAIRAALA
jgi:beta-phosphoglucomutase